MARTMSRKARKAVSVRMTKYWADRRRAKAKKMASPAVTHAVENVGKQEGVRLIAYGFDPNSEQVALHTSKKFRNMLEALPEVIDLIYNGHPMSEIRLEDVD